MQFCISVQRSALLSQAVEMPDAYSVNATTHPRFHLGFEERHVRQRPTLVVIEHVPHRGGVPLQRVGREEEARVVVVGGFAMVKRSAGRRRGHRS